METKVRKQIVSIGSMAYNHVLNGSSVYCAAKAGMAMFMKCVAHELGPKGYDCFSIHPSNVEHTPMTEDTIVGLMRYRHLTREEAEAYWSAGLNRERFLNAQDIANVVLDTLRHPYLSGCNIELAGGNR